MDATLHKAADRLHGAVDRLAGAADGAVRQVEPAIERAAQSVHHAVSRVADAAGPTVDWLSEHGESLNARSRKMSADTGAYVRENPWKSIGAAAIIGFVISRFVR